MSLGITLQNAISGLQTSQQSLQVISNNIANVNVEGYSRKIISQTSRVIDGQGYGVDLAQITRTVDEGILRKLRAENGELQNLSIRETFLTQVNAFFGRPEDNNSLTHLTSEFASNIDALAVTPETSATQFLAVKAAKDVLQELDALSEEVQRLRSEANSQIGTLVSDFNAQMDSVVSLNLSIIEFSASNISTAELEDQRDLALNKMADTMDILYFQKSDASITVFTGGGTTLVDGTKQALSYNQPAVLVPTLEYTPTDAVNYASPQQTGHPVGGIPGIFVGEQLSSSDITNSISSGKLKGLIELRDTDLQAVQRQLDEYSEKLKTELNKVHNQGVGFPPPPTLTGDLFVQSTTNIDASTGLVRIAVVDEDGNLLEDNTLDLTNYTTVAELLTNGSTNGINDLFTNLSASVTSEGKLQLAATGNRRIAINELNSNMSAAGKLGRGFSDFFGLNNMVSSSENYSAYRGDFFTSQTAATVTTASTIQFSASGVNTTVAVAANASLDDIVTAINANGTLSTAGITASVISDGNGVRLQVIDSGGDDFQMVETAGGSMLTDTGLRTDTRGISNRLSIRSDVDDNAFYISRGSLQSNTWLSSTSANTYTAANDAIGGAASRTLTITGASFSTTVTYNGGTDDDGDGTNDTIADAVTRINANATLQAQNITASVIFDNASGEFQVKIIDGNGDNFEISDNGQLTVATNQGVSIGDGSIAADLAAVFESTVSFAAAPPGGNGLAQADTTFSTYSANILAFNSAQVSSVTTDLSFQENLTTEIFNKHSSITSVNMDEELAQLIIFEQAYLAAARMITTTSELFRELADIV